MDGAPLFAGTWAFPWDGGPGIPLAATIYSIDPWPEILEAIALAAAALPLVTALLVLARGALAEEEGRRWARRALLFGVGACLLLHAAAGWKALHVQGKLQDLGAWVTLKDHAAAAVAVVERSWAGTALLLACLVVPGSLLMAGRGRRRWALEVAVALVALFLAAAFATDAGLRMDRWKPEPPPPLPAGTWIPPEVRLVFPSEPESPAWLLCRPATTLLLVPAGALALLGLVELMRAAKGRRPRFAAPTDPLLLAGLAAAACVAVLHVETAFLERATVVLTYGRKAPPLAVLGDDLALAAAPGVAVLWAAVAALALGLLERRREGRAAAGAPGTGPVLH